MTDYIVTAIDRFGETFKDGEVYTFSVSAASKDEVMEVIYSDHPKVCVAWIGDAPVIFTRVSQAYELELAEGPQWYIAEAADYCVDLYEERIDASRLPETVEDGTVDFLGWTYHVEGGYVIRKTCDGVVKHPYLHYGEGYTSDTPLYTEWRHTKVDGKSKWRWM